jgi:SAM-dependent methyltransferase
METRDRRETYASLRAGREPNLLLLQALDILKVRNGRALDIGAGPLNDTRFLLRAGFSVDAVDRDPHTRALAAGLRDPRFKFVHADIRDVPIEANAYSLMLAIHVLPFLPRTDLPRIISSMVDGLCQGGILCCTFLGPDDSWAQKRPHMAFYARSELDSLFSRLQSIVVSDCAYDGTNAKDEPKRWHVLRCIFRKEASKTLP